jgi:hypothetical protein
MFTSGDIQFEPTSASKVYAFGIAERPAKVVCLSADDSDLAFMVAQNTHRKMMQRGVEFTVQEVAHLYTQQFIALRKERAERLHLTPLGLDFAGFLSRQQGMDPGEVTDITERLWYEELLVESLIVGVDTEPHIYHVFDPGQVVCRDRSAFWAIGSGRNQFEIPLMSSGYDSWWSLPDTLLLMYSAKKNAERSPGVGRITDMFYIDADGFRLATQDSMSALDEHYRRFEETVRINKAEAITRMLADQRIWW